ncbi:hypothetical protein DMUE_3907 [Dictyocoela muelleri]|nr:hypothetical protein DMUE_3907 [Dictyocoela muelleri]
MDWNDHLVEQKMQEILFNGLDPYTKLELSKYSKCDYKSVYESILSTEKILIENLQKELLSPKNEIRIDEQKIIHVRKNFNSVKVQERKEKKICSFHKSPTHNDEECRSKKKNNDNYKKIGP